MNICALFEMHDSFMFVDYGIDEGDDPFSEDTWKKANPNYGVSIEPETFRRTAKKAQNEVLNICALLEMLPIKV
jgi:phage terminase large subunit-like protein